MANIRQVAAEAGVSIATVSRVLSGDPNFSVKEDTVKKIHEAAERLGYKLPPAKHLQYHFGCILSHTADKYSDPFFIDIIDAMETECRRQRAGIVVSRSYKELDDPVVLEDLLNSDLDGLFVMERISQEIMDKIKARIPHIILIDKDDPFYEFDCIGFDHRTANFQVMNELFRRGYKRIAMISGSSPGTPLQNTIRHATYLEAHFLAGITPDYNLIKDCHWDLSLCEQQVKELMEMDERPEAIFAGSDSLASVVLGTLFSMNIRCPEDVGVIGFNNIQLSAHMVPPLTTIEIPTNDIGRTAVKRMMRIIADNDSAVRKILFPTKYIDRKSLRFIDKENSDEVLHRD